MEIVLIIVVALAVVGFFFLRKKSGEPAASKQLTTSPDQPESSAEAETRATTAGKDETRPGVAQEREAPSSEARSTAEEPETAEGPATPEAPIEDATRDEPLPSLAPDEDEGDEDDASPPPPPVRTGTSAARRAETESLRKGLARSRSSEGFFGRLKQLLGGKKELDPKLEQELEEILLTSDVGVSTTEKILQQLKETLSKGDLDDEAKVLQTLKDRALDALQVEGRRGGLDLSTSPTVVLLVGVNGAGKTTTIGKLAQQLTDSGKKVMLAAGDTFRAAAVAQLEAWGTRTNCEVISGKPGADPSSVIFDAVQAARRAGVDVLLADTAGRLHTKTNLMQEMTKIQKTAAKALDGAPHETLLVIDSTNGQNAMAQAREFREALPLTGLVLTKLDGTARGGVVLGICDTLQVPVRYVGVGEKPEDLHEFDARAFVEALLGSDEEEIAA